MSDDGMAIVSLVGMNTSSRLVVPAAHIFDTADGFAFITPGYLFPNAAGQNYLHQIQATVEANGTFSGPEWEGEIQPYEPTATQILETGYALEDYRRLLADKGLTIEGERARLRHIVADDQA